MNLIKNISGQEIGRIGCYQITIEVFFPITQELLNFVEELTTNFYLHENKITNDKVFVFRLDIDRKYMNVINNIISNSCYALLESNNENKNIRLLCELFVKHLDSSRLNF